MDQLEKAFKQENIGKVVKKEAVARHTTLKVGGPADLFIEPKNLKSLQMVLHLIREAGVKWRVIGRGSNLLVDDAGVEGVVIKLSRGIDHLKIDGEEVTVGSGYSLIALSAIVSKRGLAGLEFAGGIPGSIGGAIYMNAGAHGSDISCVLKKARILFEDGQLEWLSSQEMAFSYRTSILQKRRGICVAAVFHLKKGDRDKIFKEMKDFKKYRRRTQPIDRCFGSVFRNPGSAHAGQLIESSGLKGLQVGGAQVSTLHANFIVNTGGATSEDVLHLIEKIKDEIRKKYKIDMVTEVEMIQRS